MSLQLLESTNHQAYAISEANSNFGLSYQRNHAWAGPKVSLGCLVAWLPSEASLA